MPVRIAVGPEGGLTEPEIALAAQHGWHKVSLGPRTLRIETAAIALVAQILTQHVDTTE
jgi:16S rRNA (uracil1498-N3)-methyltransferase